MAREVGYYFGPYWSCVKSYSIKFENNDKSCIIYDNGGSRYEFGQSYCIYEIPTKRKKNTINRFIVFLQIWCEQFLVFNSSRLIKFNYSHSFWT